MIRSLSAISISLLVCTTANAGIWTVSNTGQNDFYTVADAMGDGRVQNGDTIKILSGSYAGFDTGDLAITIEPGNSPGIVNLIGGSRIRANSGVNFEISGLNSGLNGGAALRQRRASAWPLPSRPATRSAGGGGTPPPRAQRPAAQLGARTVEAFSWYVSAASASLRSLSTVEWAQRLGAGRT
jgi:hypothetical protein